MTNLCNKIILTPGKRVQYQAYMKAIKEKALGFITTTGDVYKNNKDVDLDPYLNRELYYKEGYIPTVMIRMKDAERILERGYKTANLTLISEDFKRNSRNVVAEIKGEIEDEIITFTAHYDSVAYSKGAYDNATGVITLLQLYEYYMKYTEQMPEEYRRLITDGRCSRERAVCDYLSGMTDQYTIETYEELYIPKAWKIY